MAFQDVDGIALFIHCCFIRDDPDFVEGVDGDVGRAEFLLGLGVHPLPKFFADLFFRIDQACGDLLEDVIFGQQVAAHFSGPKILRDDAVFLIRRQIDPLLCFRDRKSGQKIFDELGVFFLLLKLI